MAPMFRSEGSSHTYTTRSRSESSSYTDTVRSKSESSAQTYTNRSFLSSGSFVYSYDKDDTQHAKLLLKQMDCSYHGYIAGFPNSLVSLNTCSGLRGTLQFKNISYGIEPMEAISGFMHVIYEEKDYNTNIPLLGDNDTYSHTNSEYQGRKSSEVTEFFKLFPRYLEIYIVVDKNLFDYMGSDIKAVTQKVIQIIGFVNTMLTQLKLTVVISSIEIWSNKNKISTMGNPNHILFRFLEWKLKHIFRPYHAAYLLAFKKQLSFIGATFPGKICNKNYAAGVALYPEGSSLESFTVSIVQLLGLNVGLSFDNSDTCYCSGDVCIMSPKAVHSGGVKDFSTCNLDEFKYFASDSGLDCLNKILHDMPVYKSRKICGNGKLEQGEQCDCGTLETCTHKDCCDPRTCTLKGSKVCGSGECCTQKCTLKPVGILCRKSFDKECDFAEYCNGFNPHCVPDTFARNGQSCDSGNAHCYGGRCRTFNKQCRDLIGGASRGASFTCFDEINSRGDRYGNCGADYCAFSNLLCGKLVCAWPHKALVSRANLSVIYTHIREDICVSTFLHSGKLKFTKAEDRDETFVQDGSACGPEMFCVNFTCREIKYLIDYRICDNSNHCNNSGICNNFNHCHCKEGFAPPDCQEMKGEFGSIDDGHSSKMAKSSLERRSTTSPKRRFQLIFYISLPVLIITAAVLIKQDKIRELCYRSDTESERSVSEESISNSKLSSSVSNSL
ncbi:disintegrin and metalloproteinase domain-containing protein 5-like [Pteropus vampyrus]|uniref:Disintegrin and metalloproteinase domain-containing protein 5-like n=1 Tax=Pteropus vampyrus TaxID=132908 RepID=A0A6P6BL68_PTEVA|nr:disintegrin and metalloproteinase domain-containing protein 5-like [Pteropus vampyrus]